MHGAQTGPAKITREDAAIELVLALGTLHSIFSEKIDSEIQKAMAQLDRESRRDPESALKKKKPTESGFTASGKKRIPRTREEIIASAARKKENVLKEITDRIDWLSRYIEISFKRSACSNVSDIKAAIKNYCNYIENLCEYFDPIEKSTPPPSYSAFVAAESVAPFLRKLASIEHIHAALPGEAIIRTKRLLAAAEASVV